MTTPLTKLIEDNKERPIAEAPTPNVDLLCRCGDSLELLRYIDKNHMRNNESGWFEAYSLQGKYKPTHFRPLPDDRLALVCEALMKGLEHLSCLGNGKELGNSVGNLIAQQTLIAATAIAEGKNNA